MTLKRLKTVLLCTYMGLGLVYAQENSDLKGTSCVPVRSVSKDSLAFRSGERLSFILHYQWGAVNSDVGSATVSLDSVRLNGHDAFLCSVQGSTTRMYDMFFKVRENFKSWFTADGIRPLKFTRDTYEGGYVAKNTYLYDWQSPEPLIRAEVYSSRRGQRYLELPLTPCTLDLPALFFCARNMDFDVVEPGKKYPMTFAIDDDIYTVYFIMHGREKIRVKGIGTVNTIRFAAKLLEGEVFKGEEDMTIWVTDDRNRVPVLFEAPLIVGVATGRLTGYEGLKYPFSSLVKPKKK